MIGTLQNRCEAPCSCAVGASADLDTASRQRRVILDIAAHSAPDRRDCDAGPGDLVRLRLIAGLVFSACSRLTHPVPSADSLFWLVQKRWKIPTKTVRCLLCCDKGHENQVAHQRRLVDALLQRVLDPGPHHMGTHRHPHRQVWFQARLGNMVRLATTPSHTIALIIRCALAQVVPSVLWPDGLPVVRVQPDHDQRGLPSATDVRSRPYQLRAAMRRPRLTRRGGPLAGSSSSRSSPWSGRRPPSSARSSRLRSSPRPGTTTTIRSCSSSHCAYHPPVFCSLFPRSPCLVPRVPCLLALLCLRDHILPGHPLTDRCDFVTSHTGAR